MAEWSRTQEFSQALITKKEYDEFGAEVSSSCLGVAFSESTLALSSLTFF